MKLPNALEVMRSPPTAVLAGLAIALVTTLLFLPSFDDPAAEMDEGALVAYPSLVLEGLVPGRDFETFYGPGQPWLVAGAFEVFGPTLTVERLVGLGFRIATAVSIFVLVMPLGVALAAIGSLAAVILLLPLGLPALAILGALAALLAALATLSRTAARGLTRAPDSATAFAVAGLLGGVAVVFRPDLLPAVLLGSAPLFAIRAPVRFIDRPSFRLGDDAAAAALNQILPRLAARSEPGDRVFVGPQDLRRTNYTDTFVHFLLPETRPASFYTELNPGAANAADSGLADELRRADAVLLTTRFDHFLEPNDSRVYGSPEPNEVVAEEFRVDQRRDTYTLYRR